MALPSFLPDLTFELIDGIDQAFQLIRWTRIHPSISLRQPLSFKAQTKCVGSADEDA